MEARQNIRDLSILLDMETLKITGEILLDNRVSLWLEAAKRIAPRTFEFIICSNQSLEGKVELPEGIKLLVEPGLGYYALKNAGARKAEGKILFFGDVDCRPDPDYLVKLLDHYETLDANIIGGRTFYDGKDFASRANSAVSWGYLHGVDGLEAGGCYLGHNVSVRRDSFPDYFGPYTARYGGDEYITARHRVAGEKIPVPQDLIIYHESMAHSLRALLDRHFREIGRVALISSFDGTITPGQMLREARKCNRGRWQNFKRHAHKFGIKRSEWWKGWLLFGFYSAFSVFAVLILIVRPSLLSKWLAYQFGDLKKCIPVAKQIDLCQQNPAVS